jgi:hypothetical protein
MSNYVDEKIIPIKVSNTDEHHQSLEEGYYISGRLETFSREKYFEGLVSAYVPDSFINMPDEVKEIKYPTNFRPDIIKTNLSGDIDLSFSLLTNVEKIDVEVMAVDFINILRKSHKGVKLGDLNYLSKEGFIKMRYFDFTLMGVDERLYHLIAMGEVNEKVLQVSFNCRENDIYKWQRAVMDIVGSIEYKGR